MIAPRSTLLAATAMLALAACGGEQDGNSKGAPSAPFGFELAMAATPAADDSGADSAAPVVPVMIDLTADELAARLKAGNIRLIDVRTDAEVAEGMIPGAEHIALDRFDPARLDLSDGREVVLYCRSGRRSAMAGELLAGVTGKPVEHLAGGITAWEEAGQPLAPR
ncbi:rhodanese-like domain-containing protein [Porphyrobacter sp. AAP60]|uniref:rhodanese-like domain-containing protein n=1 Tax=Porphyrobacter sp. AAP60 TaxID=1523423 RepID=UPI0006B87FF7|nr:rhodanese-like domain-containing protein [Porphyrobacter sp. AAP60]